MKYLTGQLMAAVAIVVAGSIAGCATVPPAAPEFEQKAIAFSPPAGMAALYVYRPYHLVGSAVHFAVLLDFKDFGSVTTDTYLFATVSPGEHVIKAAGGLPLSIASIRLNAEAGRLYFFKVSPGWSQLELREINEAAGRAEVSKLRLSGDNAIEFNDRATK